MTRDGSKAAKCFEHARVLNGAGNFDDAIEMFLEGLSIVPENVAAHAELRELALKRKAGGGGALGTFNKLALRIVYVTAFDPRRRMLVAEELLAYDPLNANWMLALALTSKAAGYIATSEWIDGILRQAADP